MTVNGFIKRNSIGLIISSVIIGLAVVVCTVVVSSTFVRVKGFGRTIAVTGAAFKQITSNFAVWEGTVTVQAPTLEAAYAEIKKDMEKVRVFMRGQGFRETDYEAGAVRIHKNYNRERVLVGYCLTQSIRVELDNVSRITNLARETSRLIEQGVEFSSGNPRYLFTKLDGLKIEMIKAATENAKLRAQQLAETTGKRVGAPTSARVGVFQIRPRYSQEVSGLGINDVTSIEKEIVSTVHMSFLIE